MQIHIPSLIIGFVIAFIIASIFVMIAFEIRKKRALAFTKRFAIISEGLSSLKALSFRVSNQLHRLKSESDSEVVKKHLKGVNVIFQKMSAGMMPPTEEIALEALQGRSGSSEERAYEDSKKFRDDIRWLRQQIEKNGIEGLSEAEKSGKKSQVKLI